MVCSGANGLGLALVIPATQSLVADLYPPEARGRAFGFLLLFSGIGERIGSSVGSCMPCKQSVRLLLALVVLSRGIVEQQRSLRLCIALICGVP